MTVKKITLTTLASESAQDVFDTAAHHLLTQGVKSEGGFVHGLTGSSEFACAYRGSNGSKCAAGVFISDDEYDPEMEGITFSSVFKRYTKTENPHAGLCLVLQRIHDDSSPNDWSFRLFNLADRLGLSTEVFGKFEATP